MPASKISLIHAKEEKLFYFVANVVVFRELDKRCLILKRHGREKVHPNKYGVIGGKLEWNDLPIDRPSRVNDDVLDYQESLEHLLLREAYEEARIVIDTSELKYINSVAFVRPDETPVMMVKFAARYKSGEVILEEGGFTDFKWVNATEVKQFQCIDGIQLEVAEAISKFTKK